jgi:hypothetical protein
MKTWSQGMLVPEGSKPLKNLRSFPDKVPLELNVSYWKEHPIFLKISE